MPNSNATERNEPSPYRDEGRQRASGSPIVINFFQASFTSSSVTVWLGRWTSPEDADALRKAIPGLTTWRGRDDADRLYAWDASGRLSRGLPGFNDVAVALDESPQLFQRLIENAVAVRLASLGFEEKGGGFVKYGKPGLFASVPGAAKLAAFDCSLADDNPWKRHLRRQWRS
jgi:hypothetical protein